MRTIKCFNQCLFSFFIFLIFCSTNAVAYDLKNSVVKIFVTSSQKDFYRPWQSAGLSSSNGSGAVIEGNKILTNAHVVSDQTFIQVKKNGDPKKYTATLEAVGHDCDLAILSVNDETFFNNIQPFELGTLSKLQDSVVVVGYPQGGDKLSITEGVVSRIEVTPYSQSNRKLLTVQIDAAINPGNSGGPVLQDGKIVGVAMQVYQNAQNIGYMIPAPIVHHFLTDLSDGSYEGFPILGVDLVTTENSTLREYYGLEDYSGGVMINQVLPYSPSENILKPRDTILKINGIPIAEDGTFSFRGEERLSLTHLVSEQYVNNFVTLDVLRNKKLKKIELKLTPFRPLVPYPNTFENGSYYIYGGLVFTTLSQDLLHHWGPRWWEKAPNDFNYYLLGAGRLNQQDQKEVVVLLDVLSDELNVGYQSYGHEIIREVNGEKFSSFKDFVQLLEKTSESQPITRLVTTHEIEIILDNENLKAKDADILKRYNIPRKYSDDVEVWLEDE